MKNTKATFTVRRGDLIAALYDEVVTETKDKKIQSLLVALALLDLTKQITSEKKYESISYSAA